MMIPRSDSGPPDRNYRDQQLGAAPDFPATHQIRRPILPILLPSHNLGPENIPACENRSNTPLRTPAPQTETHQELRQPLWDTRVPHDLHGKITQKCKSLGMLTLATCADGEIDLPRLILRGGKWPSFKSLSNNQKNVKPI